MLEELKAILKEEELALEETLTLLENQHEYVRNKDVFGMEAVTVKLQINSKRVAEWEVKRRQITGNDTMAELLQKYDDNELEDINRKLSRILHSIQLQKETNELLIKQQLSFTRKLLEIINPRRETVTYGSAGQMRR